MSDIRAQTYEILSELSHKPIEEISDNLTIKDLGVDSLALVEAIFAIEEKFDIEVPFNANNPNESGFDISTVGSMVNAIEALVQQKS